MKYKKGFTLIELLVVIAVIGFLASVVFVNLQSSREKVRIGAGQQFDSQLKSALGVYAVGVWRFEESSGNIAVDESGSGNNGTLVNGVTRVANPTLGGNALSFDGIDDYVETSNNIGITGNSARSISFWVYTRSLPVSPGEVVVGWGTSGAKAYSQVVIQSSGVWNFWGSAYDFGPVISVVLNTWEHHVVSFDGTTMYWYRNGAKVTSGDMSLLNTGDSRVRIGTAIINPHFYNGYHDGLIDEVRIYNSSLTVSQIQKLYAEGLPRHQLVDNK